MAPSCLSCISSVLQALGELSRFMLDAYSRQKDHQKLVRNLRVSCGVCACVLCTRTTAEIPFLLLSVCVCVCCVLGQLLKFPSSYCLCVCVCVLCTWTTAEIPFLLLSVHVCAVY